MKFEVGTTVGDYQIVGVLGSGGMGQVYKVQNVLSHRFEAMKVLLPGSIGTADAAERFLREIRVQASLNHPNIAQLRTAMRVDDQLIMIIELVEGTTLQAILAKGPLPLKTAVAYAIQALSALGYAHQHGVIHRDVKPANIIITRDGTVKLTDFGIAKAAVDRTLTATGATMGSLYYMSPEQVQGKTTLDGRSDLYSLGVTLYEMATGTRPFEADTDFAVYSAHLNQAPPSPQQKNPAIPADLSQAILKSLAKDPGQRFQTADEFQQALQGITDLPEQSGATVALPASQAGTVSPSAASAAAPVSASRTPGTRSAANQNLEMGNVLFMDIVAYSTLKMDEQSERIQQLVDVVRSTDEFRKAQQSDQIISLPTGDGMALVFFQNPLAPVECAAEISRALKSYPEIKLRMGVHTGPVYRIPDINTNRNVAGGGINMAQRVMDCGDAGHILVSKAVADTLVQLSDWAGFLHDIGEAEVKHGVKVHIVNFYTGDVGNPELPQKIKKTREAAAAPATTTTPAPVTVSAAPAPVPAAPKKRTGIWIGLGAAVAVAAIAMALIPSFRGGESSREKAPVVSPAASPVEGEKPPSPPSGGSGSIPPPVNPPSAGAASITPPPSPTPPSVPSAPAKAPTSSAAAPKKVSEPPEKAEHAAAAPAPVQRQAEAAPAPAPPPSAQPAADSPDKAQLQELRERMMLLGGRAAAVHGSLDNLERQQNRSGLSLRGDMAAAKTSMDYLMSEAKSSLAAGDAASAKRNLDMAEKQVEKLEGFLGR